MKGMGIPLMKLSRFRMPTSFRLPNMGSSLHVSAPRLSGFSGKGGPGLGAHSENFKKLKKSIGDVSPTNKDSV